MEMNELRLLQELGDKLDKLIEMLDKERNQAAHEKKFYMPLCKGIKELAAMLGAEVHYPRRCGGFDYSKLTCTYNGVRFTQAGQAQDTIKYDFF